MPLALRRSDMIWKIIFHIINAYGVQKNLWLQEHEPKEMVDAYEGLRFSWESVLKYAENVCGVKILSEITLNPCTFFALSFS